jgi:hypothetical protein
VLPGAPGFPKSRALVERVCAVLAPVPQSSYRLSLRDVPPLPCRRTTGTRSIGGGTDRPERLCTATASLSASRRARAGPFGFLFRFIGLTLG